MLMTLSIQLMVKRTLAPVSPPYPRLPGLPIPVPIVVIVVAFTVIFIGVAFFPGIFGGGGVLGSKGGVGIEGGPGGRGFEDGRGGSGGPEDGLGGLGNDVGGIGGVGLEEGSQGVGGIEGVGFMVGGRRVELKDGNGGVGFHVGIGGLGGNVGNPGRDADGLEEAIGTVGPPVELNGSGVLLHGRVNVVGEGIEKEGGAVELTPGRDSVGIGIPDIVDGRGMGVNEMLVGKGAVTGGKVKVEKPNEGPELEGMLSVGKAEEGSKIEMLRLDTEIIGGFGNEDTGTTLVGIGISVEMLEDNGVGRENPIDAEDEASGGTLKLNNGLVDGRLPEKDSPMEGLGMLEGSAWLVLIASATPSKLFTRKAASRSMTGVFLYVLDLTSRRRFPWPCSRANVLKLGSI
ncbi:hypothetical protein CC78DRAFT_578482 [Lojkania enalia]|uniref:Uncharacterized protein n=1 Tax=Lojkania enalia TaxID=147567 RepID=A0A9P4N4T6_9PLEO|nr:hypothetical protein CC78DRAFT_578482 [Didymosphaeria enalia]